MDNTRQKCRCGVSMDLDWANSHNGKCSVCVANSPEWLRQQITELIAECDMSKKRESNLKALVNVRTAERDEYKRKCLDYIDWLGERDRVIELLAKKCEELDINHPLYESDAKYWIDWAEEQAKEQV